MPSTKKRVEVLGGILRRLRTFDMTTFQGRLVLQKTVYLLQAMGIYLGYKFSWYLYGPYSPELAQHGFELAGVYGRLSPLRFSKERQQRQFDRFVEFLGKEKGNPIRLEALASIHFLRTIHPAKRKQEIVRQVIGKQPYFNQTICKEAWQALEDAGLIACLDH